jgi:hypothetical protein
MRRQLAADLFKYSRRSGVEVKDRKGATFSLELKGIADGAVVPSLSPHAERRRRAALDQRLKKPLLFECVPRAQHRDLGIVSEAERDRLFGHKRTAARERCVHAMHCVAEIFQQRSLVFRTAG